MAGSTYGRLFTITTWGESHGKGIGVVVDGCPAGLPLNEEDCAMGQFYNLLGEAVGHHCTNGKLFFYDQNGELSATIDWKHTWRDA